MFIADLEDFLSIYPAALSRETKKSMIEES